MIKSFTMTQVAPSEPSVVRSDGSPGPPLFRWWQAVILAVLFLWLYLHVIVHLVAQWWSDPNFSHGFFVPLFSAFIIWQERDRLARLARRPSWWGLLFLALGLCILIVGQLGAELFLSRLSLLIVLAGMIVLFLGWNFFRALLFPFTFLLLMIPIPVIVFNQITFPLQLLASKVAGGALALLGVPVLREGNVIVLPAMALEVAEACSGIRSLMSLATLAVIYGYMTERRILVRVLLAAASIPIAVAANSFRIVGTGLLVQYWDPQKAEGFFHEFSGWLIFVVSLGLLYLTHRLLSVVWPENALPNESTDQTKNKAQLIPKFQNQFQFAGAAALIAVSALLLQARSRTELIPPHLPLANFPAELVGWPSTEIMQDKATLEVLGHGDFLERNYRDPVGKLPDVDLFLAYFPSQRAGETPHSPQHCLPGSGWNPDENVRVMISVPGHTPFPANRYVISKGEERDLVLYWFWAHDRGVASEYWAKFYLVKDAIRMNRSDGSLVRLVTPMLPGEPAAAAQQRIRPFTSAVVPLLDNYIPR